MRAKFPVREAAYIVQSNFGQIAQLWLQASKDAGKISTAEGRTPSGTFD
jgi:hypothetical protein